jgi:hypothetical protein
MKYCHGKYQERLTKGVEEISHDIHFFAGIEPSPY